MLFVDTADTDLNNGENIKLNKLWAYFYILTVPAAGALIYAGDYERYGLAPDINNLMWISATFAIGKITWEYADGTLLAWSRDGDGGQYGWSGGLLCGFSTDPINSRSEWMNTPFGSNRHLHDYTGHGPDIWTNADGWALVPFGPNVYGSAQNTVAYAPAGVEHTIPIVPRADKQTGSLTDFSDY